MSNTPKKQSFLHGAALLAIATAVVKIIGAIYKLPLKGIIGDEGYSYFSSAYDIYNVLLLISTAGLPVAMSRMISQATSLGDTAQVKRVYNTSRAVFWALALSAHCCSAANWPLPRSSRMPGLPSSVWRPAPSSWASYPPTVASSRVRAI